MALEVSGGPAVGVVVWSCSQAELQVGVCGGMICAHGMAME